jgi:hypothetical protein
MSLMLNCSKKFTPNIFLLLFLCCFDFFNSSNLLKANKISNAIQENKLKIFENPLIPNVNMDLNLNPKPTTTKFILNENQKANLIEKQVQVNQKNISIPPSHTHPDQIKKEKLKESKKSIIISDQNKINEEINSNSKRHNDYYQNQSNFFSKIHRPHFYSYANLKEKCNPNNCPLPNKCISNKICKCSEDRANFFENPLIPKVFCSYSRKKQLIAFVLETSLIAAGHFYIGSYLIGCFKLFTLLSAIFLAFRYEEKWTNNLSTFLFSSVFVFWVVDIGLFSINFYMDNNNVQLMGW